MLGVLLGLPGIVVLIDPLRFDWSDRAVVEGHAWLLLAGFSAGRSPFCMRAAIAGACSRSTCCPGRCRWRRSCSGSSPSSVEPRGYLDFSQPNLWIALLYIGVFAGPTGTWAAVSVARALPPVTGSLGMLGTPLLGIAASVVLVGEPVTWPLVLGTCW